MFDSVRPHRRQPTRLPSIPPPRPWDSPGKNTGVGCHFLFQCMKMKSESEDAQSCPTLSDPVGRSLPGSSIHGIFQARVLEWGAIAFSALLSELLWLVISSIFTSIQKYLFKSALYNSIIEQSIKKSALKKILWIYCYFFPLNCMLIHSNFLNV